MNLMNESLHTVESLDRFMREPDTTVVYTFKNAAGSEIVLKRDCATNHVVDVYNELVELAQKILESQE